MAFLVEPNPPRQIPLPVIPGICRIVAPNPGPMTYHGTNTYLVDMPDGVVVLDPGPADAPHLHAVARAANGRAMAILLSHGHADHCAGVSMLADMLGTPVLGHESFTSRVASVTGWLRHGDRIGELTCLHTPGHAMDHLCFALPGGIVFSGDHVMSWSSSVVPFPSGDMRAYLANLAMLRDRRDRLLLPGHGPAVRSPSAFVDQLIDRRLKREGAIMTVLGSTSSTPEELVHRLYEGRASPAWRAAVHNVRSHLEKLQADGRVVSVEDGRWQAVTNSGRREIHCL